ncbi:hypothetical protein [Streptomyces sp. H51]|uniref:hypothetical protein n=1 Tax=Streptomyces sp. H51 TaxID=3111770 RepID=UPI002D797153|nr:hypothetical protein [Streptomyces sp. H51]
MSLVELIAQADERGLAASGLACLDRCLPLLGGDDEALRPLWAGLAGNGDWAAGLEQARGKLAGEDATGEDATGEDATGDGATGPDGTGEAEAVLLARRMLAAAPAELSAAAVREWADGCSVAALRIHRLLDPVADGASSVDTCREGRTDGASPLVAAELRRQIAVLELLAAHGAGGLRGALEASVEGRRVLRAVVSRRARGRG